MVGEQDCPGAPQVPPAWHLPPVHVSPLQQSAESVQVPPWGWHAFGFEHNPPLQIAEQHWLPASQCAALGSQVEPASVVVGTWQAVDSSPAGRHWVPLQHVGPASTPHSAPTGKQVWSVHTRTPASLGTQGNRLQHSPAELHTSPGERQQPGMNGLMLGQPASQVGELGGHWPKHLGTPAGSKKHGSLLIPPPGQQSTRAVPTLSIPPSGRCGAPQMFPGALQDWTLLQVWLQVAPWVLPQHSNVEAQGSPATEHPAAGTQMGVPVPRFSQM